MKKLIICASLLLCVSCVSNDQEGYSEEELAPDSEVGSEETSDNVADVLNDVEEVDPSVLSEDIDSQLESSEAVMEEEDSNVSEPLTDGDSPLVVEESVTDTDTESYKLSDSTEGFTNGTEPKPFIDEKEAKEIEAAEEAGEQELATDPDSEASELEKEYSQETLEAQSAGEVLTDSSLSDSKLATTSKSKSKVKSKKVATKSKASKKSKKVAASSYSPNNSSVEVEDYSANSEYVTYVVQPNDTLGSISTLMYGTKKSWKTIADYNHIKDPNKVYPGDVLKIKKTPSCKDLLTNYQASQKQSYTVEKGDTLAKISQKLLHSQDSWRYIWSFNKKIVPNPNRLSVGQVLTFIYPYPSK